MCVCRYAAFNVSSFTFSQSSTVPTCTAAAFPLTANTNPTAPVVYNFCSYLTADTSATGSVGSWSIVTNGTLSLTPTFFTSFATTDSQFYQIGTAITGQRTYTSGSTVNTVQITGLLSPGGDGQNNNKLYNGSDNATPFDDGGWSYTVSATPTMPGISATAATTTIIRLYYANSRWSEQALPSFQTIAPTSTSSTFTVRLASQGTLQCGPNSGNNNNNNAAAAGAGASAGAAVVLAGAAAAAGVALLW